jgi:hypothetical protein
LPSEAVEILLCLASKQRLLISREELLRSVWGEGRGSHEALGYAIGELRHVFDDHLDDPKYIQTLPKRGYRSLTDPRFTKQTVESPIPVQADAWIIDILGELTRYGVIKTRLTHLVIGWLLIQFSDVTFCHLGLPNWSATFVAFLVIGDFPIALVLAWFIEIIDKGHLAD